MIRKLLSKVFVLAALASPFPAFADLAHGTPLVTCTAPTQQIDSFGNLTTIPATGTQALAGINFYLDASVDANGNITAGTVPKKTVLPTACTWQTALNDISAGSHTIRATAVNNASQESKATNPLAFVVPAPTIIGPVAPSGVTVQ